MNKIDELVNEIKKDLYETIDEARLQSAIKNHPTKLKILGVKVPDERRILKKYSGELKKWRTEEILELAKSLIATGIFECQNIAYRLYEKNNKLIRSISAKDVTDFRVNQDNWVTVDIYSVFISGCAWREGVIADSLIEEWAESEEMWTRRTAVVSTVALNQKSNGGTGDTERTLKICRKIAGDKTDLIAKAQSWALRVLSQVDKDSVIGYLNEFEIVLPARVKKEVWNKIKTGRKF